MPRNRPRRDEGRRRPSPPRRPRSPPRQNGRPFDSRGGESYRPRDQDHQGRADSYRPPQGDFTFRVGAPAGAPHFPSAPFPSSNRGSGDRRGNRGGRGGRGRGGRRWPPPHLSERALLSNPMGNLPEERLHDTEGAAKFRDLDEISDDDELDMEISSRSSQSDTAEPSKKRAKTSAEDSSANAEPKWSNPDPYTALPCPDDTLQKKKDVVALIRKARNEEAEKKSNAPQEAEDFIAFDSSSEDEEEPEQVRPELPPKPPTEPPPPLPSAPPPPLPGSRTSTNGGLADQRDPTGPLGSRKRTANDEIKPPDYGQLKKVNMKKVSGSVTHAWEPIPGEDSCPWATVDHSDTTNAAFR